MYTLRYLYVETVQIVNVWSQWSNCCRTGVCSFSIFLGAMLSGKSRIRKDDGRLSSYASVMNWKLLGLKYETRLREPLWATSTSLLTWRWVSVCLSNISNTKNMSKHREESWKYDEQRSIFDELWVVLKFNPTMSWVFDISSKPKLKLGRKRRCKTVKSMPDKIRYRNIVTVIIFFLLTWWIIYLANMDLIMCRYFGAIWCLGLRVL